MKILNGWELSRTIVSTAFSVGLSLGTLCVVGAVTPSVGRSEVDDKAFESSMDKYLAAPGNQEKIAKALEAHFKRAQADQEKAKEEQANKDIEEQFKNPIKIDVGSSPVKGPAGAKVTVVEFSDFQCPYCKRGHETMQALAAAYPNDVKVVFKHFPLEFHPEAKPAARASIAAMKQGKFWEFYTALFDNQATLGEPLFTKIATDLKLDLEKFKKDMASPETDKMIKADQELGKKNGIQGTPGFFVNGVAVRGAYPIEHFKKIVDRWLAGGAAPAAKG